ncbi:MAG: thiamine phosphate synthase, partial [Acidobacteria bacterium]|nr:thiamine phosphate synthase [Acidobacteriota bacterium]
MSHPTKPFVLPRLYAILDPSQLKDTSASEAARQLVEAGVKLIQYRNKKASSRELYEGALRLTQAVSRSPSKVVVIINDRAEIALLTGAAVVHVGQD